MPMYHCTTGGFQLPTGRSDKLEPMPQMFAIPVAALDRAIVAGLRPVDGAGLAAFRIGFGLLGLLGVIRFFAYGWIDALYIAPEYHFTYWGFSWIQPWPGWGMYLHFGLMGLCSLGIALGYKYRACAILYFLAFTYVELLDKTNYLNHYYLVSLLSFLIIFMPLHRTAALDARGKGKPGDGTAPAWTMWVLRGQLAAVYLFAGIAKLNSDWLWAARPLRIWLHQNGDLPVLALWPGELWPAYLFSWAGLIFDLTIVFWLLGRRTRLPAWGVAVVFHILTWLLFPIGVFPWVMILGTTLFFAPDWPRQLVRRLRSRRIWRPGSAAESGDAAVPAVAEKPAAAKSRVSNGMRWAAAGLLLLAMLQVAIPLRHYAYPGNVRWNEEGYRFAWRVLLSEKAGFAQFRVRRAAGGGQWLVGASGEYLTPGQWERMAHQPDLILATAHIIAADFERRGWGPVEVYADVYVAFNGYLSRRLVNPTVDLAREQPGLGAKDWVLTWDDSAAYP